MSQRHHAQNGYVMLVTTNTKDRKKVFANAVYAREAIEVLYRVQSLHPFFLYGFVVMPNHVHLLLRIVEPGSISKLMNRYKMGVSHSIGIGPIWQPRFHVRLAKDPHEALQYIHRNPITANLAETPETYPWSSASGQWDVVPLETI